MSWRFPPFGSSQQQLPDQNFQDIPTQAWYPPLVVGSSSHPSTPSSSSASPHQRASDHPQYSSLGQPSPAEAAGIIARLKDKRVDELQRLLKDKETYNVFFSIHLIKLKLRTMQALLLHVPLFDNCFADFTVVMLNCFST